MKTLIKLFLISTFLTSFSYAITPYSLEGIKSVNVKVFDKSKLVSKETIAKIHKDTETALKKMGIEVNNSEFLNFIIKIQAEKIHDMFFIHVSLFTIENVIPQRDKNLQSLAITYYIDDMFSAKELESEVYDSAIEFLLSSFEEQYKAEN